MHRRWWKCRKLFFLSAKTLYWVVRGGFHGDRDFFVLLIVPSVTRDNLEIKKVEISMKNPKNYPIKCFALIKKITSCTFIIAGALIVILSPATTGPFGEVTKIHIQTILNFEFFTKIIKNMHKLLFLRTNLKVKNVGIHHQTKRNTVESSYVFSSCFVMCWWIPALGIEKCECEGLVLLLAYPSSLGRLACALRFSLLPLRLDGSKAPLMGPRRVVWWKNPTSKISCYSPYKPLTPSLLPTHLNLSPPAFPPILNPLPLPFPSASFYIPSFLSSSVCSIFKSLALYYVDKECMVPTVHTYTESSWCLTNFSMECFCLPANSGYFDIYTCNFCKISKLACKYSILYPPPSPTSFLCS